MRNLLALIGLVVVLFGGLGWYLGWYSFSMAPGLNGRQRVELDVDTNKIATDAKRFGESVGSAVQSIQTKTTEATKPAAAEFVGPPLPPDHPAVGPILPGLYRDPSPSAVIAPSPLPGPNRR